MNILIVSSILALCICLSSAGHSGGYKGDYKGGDYKGGDYKGGDGNYQETTAATTAATTVATTVATTTVAARCLDGTDRICAATCTIGTFTVEVPGLSCEGNGVGSICCGTA